jgi:serine/threonine protein kinase
MAGDLETTRVDDSARSRSGKAESTTRRPGNVRAFVECVATSGLLNETEIESLRKLGSLRGASEPREFAREVVRAGTLTGYQAAQLLSGRTHGFILGNYVIQDVLGGGGMGHVFRAIHRRMKRVVAIKILPRESMRKRDAVSRFEREVEAAARLTHPNIVAAYDADEAKGVHFLVMEYVDGADLHRTVKDHGPLSVADAVSMMRQAARALAYAHRSGVVHRDIKPHNLLRDAEGTVKVLDMGLARLTEGDSRGESAGVAAVAASETVAAASITQDGQFVGTADYAPPEQIQDTAHTDGRADLYSLGCTLFFVLSGRPMFGGTTMREKLLHHLFTGAPSLKEARPDAPDELEAIFRRLVEKSADRRYRNAEELLAALDKLPRDTPSAVAPRPHLAPEDLESSREEEFLRFLNGVNRDEPAGSTQPGGSTTPPSIDRTTTSVNAATDAGTGGRWRIGVGIAVAVALLLVVIGAAARSRRPRPEAESPSVAVEGETPAEDPAETPIPEVAQTKPRTAHLDDPNLYVNSMEQMLHGMAPQARYDKVRKELIRLNPGLDESSIRIDGNHEGDRVQLRSANLKDLRPIAALPDLRVLNASGSETEPGSLSDLEPLRRRRLYSVTLMRNPDLVDFGPLEGMPLGHVDAAYSGLRNLLFLKQSPIKQIQIQGTAVVDLTPLAGMNLQSLDLRSTPVDDLKPLLKVSSLEQLRADQKLVRRTPIDVLAKIPGLQRINDQARPAANLFKKLWQKD